MADYIKLFETHAEYNTYANSNDMLKPNVSFCSDKKEVHFNPWTWADEYMQTVALEDGTISFNILRSMGTDMIASISYSTDNGETWTTTNNTNEKSENIQISVNVQTGDKVLWKGDAKQLGFYDYDENVDNYVGSFFSSTCEFDAKGNIMSLIYGDNYKNNTTIEYNGQFVRLFNDYEERLECNVVNAKDLSLPATILTEYCYNNMFGNCTSLETAPEFPVASLATNCYNNMFGNCTSLATAPQLPSTSLASACYAGMFFGCTSLTTAPELPATTLEQNCYCAMFQGCTSLTTPPKLHSTTLETYCYYHMFLGCTSLVIAPELPATTLPIHCYDGMFSGCTSLNYIKAMFTTTPSSSYTNDWVKNVSSNGTFVKNSAAEWNVTGNDAIPENWTVETASA